MPSQFDRRSFLVAGGGLLAAGALPRALAQGKAKPKMRFSGAFTEQDLRAEAYKNLWDPLESTCRHASLSIL